MILSKQSCEYGNVAIDNTQFIFTSGSLAFITDELNISFTTDAELTSKVGVYDLYLHYNNDNYDVSLNQDSELKISPRSLTIALTNHSSMYGEPVVLNNTDYSIISGSLFNNDNLNFELKTLATSQSSVGNYSINCKNSNTNYRITLTNNKYEITKRPITIKLKDQSTPHGIMFNIDQNAYEIVEGTLVDGTSLGIKIKSNAGKLSFIGNYNLTATAENENYDVIVVEADLKLKISFEDVCLVIIVVIVAITVPIAVVKHKKKKNKNKELFDKYIGW